MICVERARVSWLMRVAPALTSAMPWVADAYLRFHGNVTALRGDSGDGKRSGVKGNGRRRSGPDSSSAWVGVRRSGKLETHLRLISVNEDGETPSEHVCVGVCHVVKLLLAPSENLTNTQPTFPEPHVMCSGTGIRQIYLFCIYLFIIKTSRVFVSFF